MFSFFKGKDSGSKVVLDLDHGGSRIVCAKIEGDTLEVQKAVGLESIGAFDIGEIKKVINEFGAEKGKVDIVVEEERCKVCVYKIPLIGANEAEIIEDLRKAYFQDYREADGGFRWEVLGGHAEEGQGYVNVALMGIEDAVLKSIRGVFNKEGIKVGDIVPGEFASAVMFGVLGGGYKTLVDIREGGVKVFRRGSGAAEGVCEAVDVYKRVKGEIEKEFGVGDEFAEYIVDSVGFCDKSIYEGIGVLDDFGIDDRVYREVLDKVFLNIKDELKDKVAGEVLVVGEKSGVYREIIKRAMGECCVDEWSLIYKEGKGAEVINRTDKVIGEKYWRALGGACKYLVCC